MSNQRELVQVNARNWKHGVISMNAPHHATCRKCGGKIWFGQVQFKSQPKPSWITYSESGHGGDGAMAMEKHDCTNPSHSGAK